MRCGKVILSCSGTGKVSLGASVIEEVVRGTTTATLTRCPACGKTTIESKISRSTVWRCRACKEPAAQPVLHDVLVPRYESVHASRWVGLSGQFTAKGLGRMSHTARSRLTISPMDPEAVATLLKDPCHA